MNNRPIWRQRPLCNEDLQEAVFSFFYEYVFTHEPYGEPSITRACKGGYIFTVPNNGVYRIVKFDGWAEVWKVKGE